jgi:hypothetical protein
MQKEKGVLRCLRSTLDVNQDGIYLYPGSCTHDEYLGTHRTTQNAKKPTSKFAFIFTERL